MEEQNILTPNQNGFRKGRRTEDNIFILHTIFQKYVKNAKKKKIYSAFIDSINRDCLFYKLLKYGISEKLYYVIKSAYNNPMFSIKTENGLTPYFASSTGVKQGCILSPILSNIFQNDLHDSFDHEGDPITLSTQKRNSILWAHNQVYKSL